MVHTSSAGPPRRRVTASSAPPPPQPPDDEKPPQAISPRALGRQLATGSVTSTQRRRRLADRRRTADRRLRKASEPMEAAAQPAAARKMGLERRYTVLSGSGGVSGAMSRRNGRCRSRCDESNEQRRTEMAGAEASSDTLHRETAIHHRLELRYKKDNEL